MSLVTVIIPTYRNLRQFAWCIHSLRNADSSVSIIVVDNNDKEEDADVLSQFLKDCNMDNVLVLKPSENLGWMKAINTALPNVKTEFVCLLNDDTCFLPYDSSFFSGLLRHFTDEKVGAVGPCSNTAMGPQTLFDVTVPATVEVFSLNGFCLVTRTALLREVGGLSEDMLSGDDMYYCLSIRELGYKCLCDRRSFIFHIGQQTMHRIKKYQENNFLETTRNKIINRFDKKVAEDALAYAWEVAE